MSKAFIPEKFMSDPEIEKKFSELNKEFDGALSLMLPRQEAVIGREREIRELRYILARHKTHYAELIGEPGTGKTAIVDWGVLQENENGKHYIPFAVSLGGLSSKGPAELQNRVENLFPKLEELDEFLIKKDPEIEIILFIDEFHMIISIFGSNSKIGGDLLKKALGRTSPIKLIAATTRDEHDSYIQPDGALTRRLKPIEINEVSKDVTFNILKNYLREDDREFGSTNFEEVDDDVLRYIIESNSLFREHQYEPAKSIDVLETAVARHSVDDEPISRKMINEIFKTEFNIDLHFVVDFKKVMNELNTSIKGQPLALFTAEQVIKKLAFHLEREKKPQTMLFCGPTGVGKTALTRALSRGIYDTESKIINLNMTDFQLKETEPDFRRILGQAITHDPSAIILLDELEKAHQLIQRSLLPILDDGKMSFELVGNDGYKVKSTVSLKNAIIIGTSNAAADIFKEGNQYDNASKNIDKNKVNEVTDSLSVSWLRERPAIIQALQNSDFVPELLGRFSDIVAFHALNEATSLFITEKDITEITEKLKANKGITVDLPQVKNFKEEAGYDYDTNELALFIITNRAQLDDSNSGGARDLKRIVDSEYLGAVIEATYENPGETHFVAQLSRDFSFTHQNNKATYGRIEVIPHRQKILSGTNYDLRSNYYAG